MPAAARKMHTHRKDVADRSHHPATRMVGLRLMNNNCVGNGTGRDWCIFGDPGFHGGRVTPRGPDPSMPPTGDRPPNIGPICVIPNDGRRPTVDVPRYKDGSSKKPLPSVVQRWHRTASAPSSLDQMARCGEAPAVPKDAFAMAHFIKQSEQEQLDGQFKPNMASYPFASGTFPVNKYEYFSEPPILKANRPNKDIRKLGAATSTYTDGIVQNLEKPVISKHQFFSEMSIRSSPSFQTTTPHDGLAKPRKAFHGAGSMTASLAHLPKRMDPGKAFPYGCG